MTKDRDEKLYNLPGLRDVYGRALKVAVTDEPVLITGDTGTGKEVLAGYVHASSQRAGSVFLPVNCAVLPNDLIDSMLFGHQKGAFTGAACVHQGYFEQADGGTLFLDEIGEFPLELQAKLLRVLDNGEFFRLGGQKAVSVDVRIVAATNRNLEQAVEKGDFREDLFYRLNVVPLEIPPLRDRPDDISSLALHFMDTIARKNNFSQKPLSMEAQQALEAHDWPGNVRELRGVLKRALIMADGDEIMPADMGGVFAKTSKPAAGSVAGPALPHFNGAPVDLKKLVISYEKSLIIACLENNAGNIQDTAKQLSVSPVYLQSNIRLLEIDPLQVAP